MYLSMVYNFIIIFNVPYGRVSRGDDHDFHSVHVSSATFSRVHRIYDYDEMASGQIHIGLVIVSI